MTFDESVGEFIGLGHSQIIVTGPQRSGTTIATKMLAHALLFDPLTEEEINLRDLGMLSKLLRDRDRFVLQAPSLSAVCHRLNVPIVFMRRSLIDIVQSQRRINWQEENYEKRQYFYTGPKPIAQVKYEAWDRFQKPELGELAFDVDYESLRSHPLWVDQEARRDFGPRQTEPISQS